MRPKPVSQIHGVTKNASPAHATRPVAAIRRGLIEYVALEMSLAPIPDAAGKAGA